MSRQNISTGELRGTGLASFLSEVTVATLSTPISPLWIASITAHADALSEEPLLDRHGLWHASILAMSAVKRWLSRTNHSSGYFGWRRSARSSARSMTAPTSPVNTLP